MYIPRAVGIMFKEIEHGEKVCTKYIIFLNKKFKTNIFCMVVSSICILYDLLCVFFVATL